MSSRPKKSTLTQQQKNKKRQRATPNQLEVLKSEFRINPTPSARDREEIGRRIDMTERSVQIWFQNKRAKAKIYERRGHSPGPDLDSPYSVLPFSGLDDTAPGPAVHSASLNSQHPAVHDQSLDVSCASLIIGSWRRVSSGHSDLSVVFSPVKNAMLYTMYVDGTGFQIEYGVDCIDDLSLVPSDSDPAGSGQVRVRLSGKPSFSVQVPKFPGRWIPCEDFSELRQASLVNEHVIVGPFNTLQVQVCQLYPYLPPKLVSATGASSYYDPLSGVAHSTDMSIPDLSVASTLPDSAMGASVLDSALSGVSGVSDQTPKSKKAQSNPSSPCSKPLLRRRSRSLPDAQLDESHLLTYSGLVSPHSVADQHPATQPPASDSLEGLITPSLKHENATIQPPFSAASLTSFNPILTSPTSPPTLHTKPKPCFPDPSLRAADLLMSVPIADSYLDDSVFDSHFSSFLF